ncbi:MAG: DUF3093 domain-containing protein [Actinomycetales bacterium]
MSAPAAAPRAAYRERLTPPVLWYVVAIVIGGSFGLVLLPFAGAEGLALGALAGATIGAGILVLTSAVVEVTEGVLRAGRAAIPVRLLGPATVLDAAEMSVLRGRSFDPRAYLCQRAWVKAGVQVRVADPADPTPYWLISSRRPDLLALAIEAQRDAG